MLVELYRYRWLVVMKPLIDRDLEKNYSSLLSNGAGVQYGIDWNTGTSYAVGNGVLNIAQSFKQY